ncbi:uncharacterized protein LOC106655627 [Trichogramma pretiosum]|uniref:uncharacterized protein LOC106655627 n=1 Tax=Trichogramma pretiosum TaxID=7493 RepID=UPI0006C9B704|nr:uncharacterized protein LOC106655627 [Trichogramma pretiosum]
MPVPCSIDTCNKPAALKRPKTGHSMCKECFFDAFETEIHATIVMSKLFKRGERVAVGASGGKDSTVLAHVLKVLNDKYDYGLDLFLLSIDEGISGYRDDSLETVKQNRDDYKLPLKILSYKDLYGWTMDDIVKQIGRKNNCTFCGVFRRQALDRGAELIGANVIVTGHNADDMAETVIMNVLRGDLARLTRCTSIVTQGEGTIPRCKPLKFAYEKEIVMYAHFKKLVYFSTECKYAPDAYRGYARKFLKDLERIRPTCFLDIIHSGELASQHAAKVKLPERRTCTRCGFVASQEICKACTLLEGLNRGIPLMGVGKSNKAKRLQGLEIKDGSKNESKKASRLNHNQQSKSRGTCGSCSTGCQSETLPEHKNGKCNSNTLNTEKNQSNDCLSGCQSETSNEVQEELRDVNFIEKQPASREKKKFDNIRCPKHALSTELEKEEKKENKKKKSMNNFTFPLDCTNCHKGSMTKTPPKLIYKKLKDSEKKEQKRKYIMEKVGQTTDKQELKKLTSELTKLILDDSDDEISETEFDDKKEKSSENCCCPLGTHRWAKKQNEQDDESDSSSYETDDEDRLYQVMHGEFDILKFKEFFGLTSEEFEKLDQLNKEPQKTIAETETMVTSNKNLTMNTPHKDQIKKPNPIDENEIMLCLIHDGPEDQVFYSGNNQDILAFITQIKESHSMSPSDETHEPFISLNEKDVICLSNNTETIKSVNSSSLVNENLRESFQNTKLSENESLIVRANPTRKGPSIVLPEMIHKNSNKLDF